MKLNPLTNYPSDGCYVLKLHRDSNPGAGDIHGVLEHLDTGDSVVFDSRAALLLALLAHAASIRAAGSTAIPDET